jgi:tripartite-type tricarboxylate transporter receptor subunit TctC
LIVPFPPGASTDLLARYLAPKLKEALDQPVIVENRPGGAGTLGAAYVAKSAPDGHALLVASSSVMQGHLLQKTPTYDSTRDFVPIAVAFSHPFVVLSGMSGPAANIKDMIAHAKANPGKLNFGSSGTGGLQHFAGEMFAHMAGVKLVHVPYKGTAAVIPAMIAGDVQLGFGTLFGVRPHIPTGRLKVLAITAGKRSPAAPEYPTVAEAGLPGYEVDQWYGVLTGAKVPAPIVRKINAGILESLKSPEVVKRFSADGSTPTGSTPEQFGKHIRSEIAKWRKLAKEANLQLTQ